MIKRLTILCNIDDTDRQTDRQSCNGYTTSTLRKNVLPHFTLPTALDPDPVDVETGRIHNILRLTLK